MITTGRRTRRSRVDPEREIFDRGGVTRNAVGSGVRGDRLDFTNGFSTTPGSSPPVLPKRCSNLELADPPRSPTFPSSRYCIRGLTPITRFILFIAPLSLVCHRVILFGYTNLPTTSLNGLSEPILQLPQLKQTLQRFPYPSNRPNARLLSSVVLQYCGTRSLHKFSQVPSTRVLPYLKLTHCKGCSGTLSSASLRT